MTKPSEHSLSQEVLAAYDRCVATPQHENERGLVEALAMFFVLADSIPPRYEHRFHLETAPHQLGATPDAALWTLAVEATSWARVYLYTNVYRARQLAGVLVTSLNAREYIASAFAARALLENTALFRLQSPAVQSALDNLAKVPRAHLKHTERQDSTAVQGATTAAFELLRAARTTVSKGRFNWSAGFGGNLLDEYSDKHLPEQIRQDHVLKAIDKMSVVGPHRAGETIRFHYEKVCDYVHPNVSSSLAFLEVADPARDNQGRHVYARRPAASDLIDAILPAVIVPTREALTQFTPLAKQMFRALSQLRHLRA